MKGFWKWFLIVLGVLVLVGISFGVALFFFRGGASWVRPMSIIGRRGMFGGMMFGMGAWMIFRFLLLIGILVLAGFGIAYLVKSSRKSAPTTVVSANAPVLRTCSHCGKVLASDWTTCPYCGAKIEPPATPPTQA
jgi:uncharacterized membrane protein